MAVLGLCCCASCSLVVSGGRSRIVEVEGPSPVVGRGGCSPVMGRGLLSAGTSRCGASSQEHRRSSCGTQA